MNPVPRVSGFVHRLSAHERVLGPSRPCLILFVCFSCETTDFYHQVGAAMKSGTLHTRGHFTPGDISRLECTYIVMENGDVIDFGLSQSDKFPNTWTLPADPKTVAGRELHSFIESTSQDPTSAPFTLRAGVRTAAARRLGELCMRRPSPQGGTI